MSQALKRSLGMITKHDHRLLPLGTWLPMDFTIPKVFTTCLALAVWGMGNSLLDL